MESIHDAVHHLNTHLFSELFYAKKAEVNPNLHNSIVAYVNYMDSEVLSTIPIKMYGFDVHVHFINSAKVAPVTTQVNVPVVKPEDELVLAPALDVHNEVWKLQRLCGKDALVDIFYEIHDGDDAVTQVSAEYPTVRASLNQLYNDFGFDVLYEELEG